MLRVRSHSFQLNLVSAFRRLARKQEASVGSRSAEFATISTIACRRKRWRFSRSGMQVAVGSLGCEVRDAEPRGPPGASEAVRLVASVIPSARWPRTLDEHSDIDASTGVGNL